MKIHLRSAGPGPLCLPARAYSESSFSVSEPPCEESAACKALALQDGLGPQELCRCSGEPANLEIIDTFRIPTDIKPGKSPVYGGLLGEQRLARLLEDRHDCYFVIGEIMGLIPASARATMLRNVRAGTGLVSLGDTDARGEPLRPAPPPRSDAA